MIRLPNTRCQLIIVPMSFLLTPPLSCIISSFISSFLVACTRLYNPPCPSVGPSVRPSVVNTLLFWRLRAVLRLQLQPNCLAGLFHHCPCPPTRDLGSRVSGLAVLGNGTILLFFSTQFNSTMNLSHSALIEFWY